MRLLNIRPGKMRARQIAVILGVALIVTVTGISTLYLQRRGFDASSGFFMGTIPKGHVALPNGPAHSVVFLFSANGGWSDAEQSLSDRLVAQNAAVIGVDVPQYLTNLAHKTEDCHYLISDIESLSHQIQRSTGSTSYEAPILTGAGVGGGLALDLVTQTPDATIGQTVVADPTTSVPFDRELCTGATHTRAQDGEVYTLPVGSLSDPVTVILTPAANDRTRARSIAFAAQSSDVTIDETKGSAQDQLANVLIAKVQALQTVSDQLPVVVLATHPTRDTMAIILSGDGGWRDLDKTIGDIFQKTGVPTVGLDSLRYFWAKRTPQDLARDITKIVKKYSTQWGTADVMLIGYSFGADVLPEAWLALDPATKAQIKQISLLGVSSSADWEITVSGWLVGPSTNARPTGPALQKMPGALLQCVYGVEEKDSPCPGLAASGGQIIGTQGGHHFDGNYVAIAKDIVDGLDQRRATGDKK